MYAEIVAAIQGTKTAIDLVKAANGLSNYSELLGAVTAVQMKLTDAVSAALASQEKQAALAERVRELEKQVAEVEDWRDQMSRYSLFEFPTGALAHALKPGLAWLMVSRRTIFVHPAWTRNKYPHSNLTAAFFIARFVKQILPRKVRLL